MRQLGQIIGHFFVKVNENRAQLCRENNVTLVVYMIHPEVWEPQSTAFRKAG